MACFANASALAHPNNIPFERRAVFRCPSETEGENVEVIEVSINGTLKSGLSEMTEILLKQLPNEHHNFILQTQSDVYRKHSKTREESSEVLTKAINKKRLTDPSGFDSKEWYRPTFEAVLNYASHLSRSSHLFFLPNDTSQTTFAALLEIDIANLGGLNEYITNSVADRVMYRMLFDAVRPIITYAKSKGIKVCAVRQGGDEYSLFLVSNEPLPMQKLWEKAKEGHLEVANYQNKESLMNNLKRVYEDENYIENLLKKIKEEKALINTENHLPLDLNNLFLKDIFHPKHKPQLTSSGHVSNEFLNHKGTGTYFALSPLKPPRDYEYTEFTNSVLVELDGVLNNYKALGINLVTQLLKSESITYSKPVPVYEHFQEFQAAK